MFLLAAIPVASGTGALDKWRIGENEPSPIQLASAGLVGIAARLAAGAVPTRAQREQEKEIEIERLKTTCYSLNNKTSINEDQAL